MRRSENAQLKAQFDRWPADRAIAIQKSFNADMDIPEYLRLQYVKDGNRNHGKQATFVIEFKQLVTIVLPQKPDFRSIWWVPRISASERSAYKMDTRRIVESGFRISEWNSADRTRVCGSEAGILSGHVRRALQPIQNDSGRASPRIPAFETAWRRLGKQVRQRAPPPAEIATEWKKEREIFIFQPVFRAGVDIATPESRRLNLDRYVLSLRGTDLVEAAIREFAPAGLNVYLYDETGPTRSLLAEHQSRLAGARLETTAQKIELVFSCQARN